MSAEGVLSLYVSGLRLKNLSFQERDSVVGLFSIKATDAMECKVFFAWITEDIEKQGLLESQ